MDKKDLYKEIGNIDDDLILEAEGVKKSKPIKRIIGVAACFVIVVGLAYGLKAPRNIVVDKTPDISEGRDNTLEEGYKLTLNEATGEMANSIHIEGHFWADLTEVEREHIYKDLEKKYEIEGTVHYSKVEEVVSIFQTRAEVQVNDDIVASLIIAPNEVAKCYVLDSEPVLSEIKGTTVNAGYFDGTNNGKIIYYADFKIEDVAYYIEFSGGKGDEEILYELIYTIVSGGKADFAVLEPIPPQA